MNKTALRAAILAQLQGALATQVNAAHLARDEAISEESRAESKYDTHGQEAAYLAEGQARIAAEIEQSISHYTAMPFPEFAPSDPIALGALVELSSGSRRHLYFLGPRAGGMELPFEGRRVMVLTPQSPLGHLLLGRRVGDSVATSARGSATRHEIVAVQ